MGAEFSTAIIKDADLVLTDAEIRLKAQAIFEQSRYNYGHAGYSGRLAEKTDVTIRRDKEFPTESAAYDYVNNLNTSKWDDAADVVPITDKGWLVGAWCSA